MNGHNEARKFAKVRQTLLIAANPSLPLQSFVPFCAFSWLLLIYARGLATAPAPSPFESEIAAFESYDRQNSTPKNAVLFVGSSSIRMWQTAESFPDLPVINRGFGGSHISDLIHFAERIAVKYAPRLIVFYAGDNDIAAGKSPQRVFDDFRTFAELVHKRLPKTHIIFLPIKPSLARWNVWPQMQEANALVNELSKSNDHVTYIDTATPMLAPNGRPRPELFLDDGLHMNAAGYRVWTENVATKLHSASSGIESVRVTPPTR